MRFSLPLSIGLSFFLAGCGSDSGLRISSGRDFHAYVKDRAGGSASSDLESMRFKPGLCGADELRPEYARLDETSLIRFFERQRMDVRVERPRADLVYVV